MIDKTPARLFLVVCAGLLLWTMTPVAVAEEVANPVENATPSSFMQSMKLSGTFNTNYQFRSFDGRDDNDIYTFFSLHAQDIIKDWVDGSFSMFWHEDLNSRSPLRGTESFDPFLDLDDASDTEFRFYTGYVDIKNLIFDASRLRLGRQFLDKIDLVHFDGASYDFSPVERLDITLFGGRPVTFYSPTSGEAIYGTNLEYRFTKQTKAAARFYRYDADSFNDDLAAFEVWHLFNPHIQTHLEFSLLDAEPYLLQNDFYFHFEDIDLDILTQVIQLFEEVQDHTINFNPFFPLLNGFEPFTYGSISVTKGITEHVSLTAGFDVKEVNGNPDPVGAFTNPNYIRTTFGAEFYPTDQLTLAVDGEYWSVDSEDEFFGITGDVEYKPAKPWTLNAGVEYGEYVQEYVDEFLFLFGQKEVFRITPEVLTYYARVKWQPLKRLYTSARFEIEDNDLDRDEWYAFRLQVGVNF